MEALGGHLSPFLCGLPEAAQSLVHDPILPSKPADGGNSFSRATSLWLWLASVPCSGSGHSHITRGTRLLSWIQVCTPAARMTSASLILSCPVTFTSSQVLGTRSWALGGGGVLLFCPLQGFEYIHSISINCSHILLIVTVSHLWPVGTPIFLPLRLLDLASTPTLGWLLFLIQQVTEIPGSSRPGPAHTQRQVCLGRVPTARGQQLSLRPFHG